MRTTGGRRMWARAGVVACTAAAAVVLGACTSAAANHTAGGADPNASGTITIGSMFPPGTLDPTTGTQGSDLAYLNFVFDSLIQLNPTTGDPEPMLATSWSYVGANKLTFQVMLRHGVTFQDGTPFNAQAVVDYTKDFLKAGDIANVLQYVTSATAVGPYEVDYHLSQQNANLPYGLSTRGGMIPSPTAVTKEGTNFATHPVGAGPYSFTSETQGASYDFTRFDKYWNNANVKRVDHLDVKIFQSDTSLVNAIRSGDVNAAFHLAPQDVATLKAVPSLTVSSAPATAFGLAYFNSSRAPLDNPKVRLAFNLALDRKALANAVTDGLGSPTTQAIPAGLAGHVSNPDPVFAYDQARAKQLMQQAGDSKGVSMTCYEYPGLGFETAGPIIIAEEKAVGINLSIIPGTPAQVGTFFTNKAQPQCFLANYDGVGDPATAYQLLWSQSFYNAGKTNYGIDGLYNRFFSTYTDSGVSAITQAITKIEQTNPGYAPMFTAPLVNVYQKKVAGWTASKLSIDNFRGMYYTS